MLAERQPFPFRTNYCTTTKGLRLARKTRYSEIGDATKVLHIGPFVLTTMVRAHTNKVAEPMLLLPPRESVETADSAYELKLDRYRALGQLRTSLGRLGLSQPTRVRLADECILALARQT
jgi:hypothetical protein